MSIYEFQLVGTSEVIEKYYPIGKAPAVGEHIYEGGKMYRRILSKVRLNSEQIANVAHGYPYESRSLPQFDADVAKTSPNGFTIVQNQAHERNLMSMTGRTRI